MSKEGNKSGLEQTAVSQEQKPGQQRKDYIGCVMSLISKQEIRYVGTLVLINSQEQTLVLQNVKSYGSEGRRGGGNGEVPPSTEIYQNIIFRASELKDFYVIKSPEKDFQDPAILSTEGKQKEVKEEKKELPLPQKEEKSLPMYSVFPKEHEEYEREYERGRRSAPRRSWHQRGSPRRVVGQYSEHNNASLKEEYQEDYDFEGMNKKFQTLFKDENKASEVEIKYDKGKSFYDSISRNKEENKEAPFDREQQRQINAETFNLEFQGYNEGRGRSSYRTRYGGGRGYRRGRGYGGRGEYSNQRRVRYYRKNV